MLDAAITLIVERGTNKTTLKEVGEQAGYSRSLAGYRFGNKTGLFEFIVRSVGEEWLQSLKRVTQNKTGFAAISAALEEHCRLCLDAPDHIRAFYILWFESIGVQSPVKKVIANIHDRRQSDVIEWIKATDYDGNLSPEDIAGQFNAAVLGIAYYWLANPEDSKGIKKLHQNLIQSMKLHF
jgi:AcrR family transcriptional regulator